MTAKRGLDRGAARTAYLGLGSNMGERHELLRAARERLGAAGVRILGSSSAYETEAMDQAAGQLDFLNACLKVETELAPEDLLEQCKSVERALGRASGGERHSPRPIDVDVLLVDSLECATDQLTLPHPDIMGRRFVLLPLLELEPELRLPGGERLADALADVAGQRAKRVGPL